MKKKQSKHLHIKLIKKSPTISVTKDTSEPKDKSPAKDSGWGLPNMRKIQRVETTEFAFCEDTLEKGAPVQYTRESVTYPPTVESYKGGEYLGVSMDDVVEFDSGMNFMGQAFVGGKINVLTHGAIVAPLKNARPGDKVYVTKKGKFTTNKKKSGVVGMASSSTDQDGYCRIGLE